MHINLQNKALWRKFKTIKRPRRRRITHNNCLGKQTKEKKGQHKTKEENNRGKAKKEAEEEEKEVVDYNKDVVSLILIQLCMTLLFANSSYTLHWTIVEHCVNLDTLSSYSWAKAISTYINDSLLTKQKQRRKEKPLMQFEFFAMQFLFYPMQFPT
ncbi:hypothetical protein GBA52_010606 [Prunus armeniaca]|nr:hypothetical protein GBA52_010606 [Prunus armeniaca]